MTLASCRCRSSRALGIVFAPQIIRLYLVASDAPDREAQIELGVFLLRWFMPQIVFYGVGAVADRAPQRAPPLRGADVRADPEQPRGDRHVRRVRDAPAAAAPSVDRITDAREDRARRRHDPRRGRDDRRALAVAARASDSGGASRSTWRHEASGASWACRLGARLRRGQPARLRRDHRARGRSTARAPRSTPPRSSSSCFPTRSSRSRSSRRCCRHGERWATGRSRRRARRFSLGLRDTVVVIVPAAFGSSCSPSPIVSLLLEHGAGGRRRRRGLSGAPCRVSRSASFLLGVPAPHTDLLRDAGQPNAGARERRRPRS